MEVVHPQEGLQIDESQYPLPNHQHQHNQQQQHYPAPQQQQYPSRHNASNGSMPASTYLGTPSPKMDYTSLPQVAPAPREQRAWLLPALLGGLVAAFIIGGAVGGGLGATLAKCHSQLDSQGQTNTGVLAAASPCPSLSPTLSTTSDGLIMDYDAPTAAKVHSIKVDCLALSSSVQPATRYNDNYVVQCNMDYPGGTYTDGAGTSFRLDDIAALWAYSFQDCIDACSSTSRTKLNRDIGMKCRSVTFSRQMGGEKANCWLKNGTLIDGQGKVDGQLVSARLS